MTLGEETRLVASEDALEKTGRNLDRERKEIIREGLQTDSRSTDVEEESLHRCTRLRTTWRLSHESSAFSRSSNLWDNDGFENHRARHREGDRVRCGSSTPGRYRYCSP